MNDLGKMIVAIARDIGIVIAALSTLYKILKLIIDRYYKPFNKLTADIKEIKKMTIENREAMAQFMLNRIVGDADYLIDKKYITVKEKKDFLNEVEKYKSLGFNHISDAMVEDIKRLPLR